MVLKVLELARINLQTFEKPKNLQKKFFFFGYVQTDETTHNNVASVYTGFKAGLFAINSDTAIFFEIKTLFSYEPYKSFRYAILPVVF